VVWEIVFLLVILKIPVLYLCWVVWWAIKAEPKPPLEPAAIAPIGPDRDLPGPRLGRRRPRRNGPHGSPRRTYARRAALARASR
jgi:hypothetical protein